MNVALLTGMSVIFYALFAIFLSRMGGKINEHLGSAIFTGLAAVIPLCYLLIERVLKQAGAIVVTSSGIIYAVLAGLAIAAWNVIIIVIFAKGGNTAYVFPITYGLGAIAIPSIIGWLFFKETITAGQAIGLGLVILGTAFIAFSKN